jgi:hypothetical protein
LTASICSGWMQSFPPNPRRRFFGKPGGHLGDLVRVLGFRQDDTGEPRPGDRPEIVPKPQGRRTVHAHVRGALRREPGRDRASRVSVFFSLETASSRSRITASAPALRAFSKRSGRLPGTKR